MMCFEPRLVAGQVYVCARYLESLLWDGKYVRAADGDHFSVTYEGRQWKGKVGSNALVGEDGEFTSAGPARLIEEEVYLPGDMMQQITGWRVSRGDNVFVGQTAYFIAPGVAPPGSADQPAP